jgi:tRNA-specific 2-thiouridylase
MTLYPLETLEPKATVNIVMVIEMKIGIALSGGVDSAVAAARLIRQGNDVTGYHMIVLEGNPLANAAVDDARAVADHLGIELKIVDLREEFRKILYYFATSYMSGETPNPCVVCNDSIKFGLLLERMFSFGAEKIATGHYARLVSLDEKIFLARALDRAKDQSYFLSRIGKHKLQNILFPLSEMTKDEVRQEALAIDLPVHSKKDSQEICFIPNGDYRSFLKSWGIEGKPGPITDESGNLLGRHSGLSGYTIGQRKGLGVSGGERYYVKRLDLERNRLVLALRESLTSDSLTAKDPNWYIDPGDGFECLCMIRSSMRAVPASVSVLAGNRLRVHFPKKVWAVTPGQLAVFYMEDRVVGSAFIEGNSVLESGDDT